VLRACAGPGPLRSDAWITPFQHWFDEIQLLIRQADTVVFVLSPGAVSSKVCEEEIAYAASLNKRFGGVVWQEVSARTVPEKLRHLQWINFEPPAPFEECMDKLAEALETDIEWAMTSRSRVRCSIGPGSAC
jgi:hypothetical protein